MKIRIKNENEGELDVFYKDKQNRKLIFPVETLMNWYPLSNAYEYKLSRHQDFLILKRMRSTLPTSYGLTKNDKKIAGMEGMRCDLKTWINPNVQEENSKIIEKAKSYNLPTIDQKFNLEDVNKGFTDLGVLFNNLKDIVIKRYLKDKTEKQKKVFFTKKEDSQLSEALKHSDSQIDLTYSDLGQIYNMLLIMKKIAKAS